MEKVCCFCPFVYQTEILLKKVKQKLSSNLALMLFHFSLACTIGSTKSKATHGSNYFHF